MPFDWNNLNDMPWLTDFPSVGESLAQGAQAGAPIAQSRANFARLAEEGRQFDATIRMRAHQAQSQQQLEQLAIANQMLDNQLKVDAASDRTAFTAAQAAWMKGDTSVSPMLKTPQAQGAWENWKADTALGKKIADENALFKTKVTALDGPGIDSVLKMRGNSPLPSSEAWAKLGEEEKRVSAANAALRATPSEVSKMVAEQRAATQRGDVEAAAAIGAVLGNKTMPPAPNQDQSNALNYADRMKYNEGVLGELEKKGFNAAGMGGVSAPLPNLLQGEDLQSYTSAKKNWISAALRKESGASIAPSEFQGADEQYFPQLGDAQKVVQQKTKLRILVEENMRKAAGPFAEKSATTQSIKQFQSEADARKAGAKSGDKIMLYDSQQARYRPYQLD